MADVNFPPAADLATMMSLPFPMYKEMQNRIGLANQFAQQNLQGGALDNQAKTLANQFAQEDNPLKIQNQRITNDNLTSDGRTKKIAADQAEATKEEALLAKRAEYMSKATEDQLKMLETQAQKDLMSDDPVIQQRGMKKFLASKSEQERRLKHQDTMEVHNADNVSRERVGAGNNAATLGAAQIGANSRMQIAKARQGIGSSVEDALTKAKTFQQQSVIYEAGAQKARMAGDDELAAHYAQLAQRAALQDTNRVTAGADARSAGQIDVGRVAGMPTRGTQQVPVPPMPGINTPMQQPAAPAAGQKPALPPGWTMK